MAENMLVNSKETAVKKRLVSKDGDIMFEVRNVSERWRFLVDLFTSLIVLKWRWVLLIFCASYVLSWLVFGCLWALLVVAYGPGYCVDQVDDFTSAFYFSVETQQTIGYGGRQITTKCVVAGLLLQLQSLFGNLIECISLGLIFSKIVRPIKRAKTVVFSKKMLINKRGNKMCLMFRLTDLRDSQIVESHVRLQLFSTFEENGKTYPYHQQDLDVKYDWNSDSDKQDQLFLLIPLTIVHVLDENSPFYDLTPDQLLTSKFELVAVLDGIVESTGMNTQAKTSYLPDEILWGYDFVNLMSEENFDSKTGKFWVNYERHDDMVSVELPRYSARDQQELSLVRSSTI